MMEPRSRKRVKLGEVLREQNAISAADLERALAEQRRSGRKLGRVLTDLGIIGEDELHQALARHLDLPYVDLRQTALDHQVVQLLPEAHARRYRALVLQSDRRGLLVGMADPSDLLAYDEIAKRLQQPMRIAVVNESELLRLLDVVYRRTDEIASLAQAVREDLRDHDLDIDQLTGDEAAADAPVLRLLHSMFSDAVQIGASDVHIEPGESGLRIRQRIDGELHEQVLEGSRVAGALVTRLKLMSGLDISEKRLPQDGRFSVKVGEVQLDVRVATMPTQFGESVVLRLLNQTTGLQPLEALGMPEAMRARFLNLIERSSGMVLVTGPTGSGKTTTLYSALAHLNRPDNKIVTVEDPVEYRLDRVVQVQTNAKIGLDFSRVLRSVLRHDPDVILVGEMRDRETVDIGLRAAITGHLVFSTLHTTSAVATIDRLMDMGAPGYMVAAAVHAVLAQRLVRRICGDCAEAHRLDEHEEAWLAAQLGEPAAATVRARHGAGCSYCNMTGYRGRVAIYELLEIDRGQAEAIRRQDMAAFAQLTAAKRDHKSLALSAIELAAAGVTTVAEAIRSVSGIGEERIDAPARRVDPAPLGDEHVLSLLA
ncbi:MAG: Flp pilus assembly complex ATPase component TadA [Gammaproteobacteria bacterium]|nr:Flp pilus assembly complex ATPase component TadA [Gammaproteobacteria bacterium]